MLLRKRLVSMVRFNSLLFGCLLTFSFVQVLLNVVCIDKAKRFFFRISSSLEEVNGANMSISWF